MKTLLARREHDSRAAEAVGMFCSSVRKYLGALSAVPSTMAPNPRDGSFFVRATGAEPVRLALAGDNGPPIHYLCCTSRRSRRCPPRAARQ